MVCRKGFPSRVRDCLATDPTFAKARFLDAVLERKTFLDTKKAPSQTDLLAYVDLGEQLGLIAAEGKVEESFDKYVHEWNNDSESRSARLNYLCSTLNLEVDRCQHLRYQLLHRTASAVYEAKRYHIREALMMVHSFSAASTWFDEFRMFAASVGLPTAVKNTCSEAGMFEGVRLRLAWVADVSRAPKET